MSIDTKYLIALIIIVVIIVMFKMLPLWVTCLNLVSFGVGIFLGYKLFKRGGEDTK